MYKILLIIISMYCCIPIHAEQLILNHSELSPLKSTNSEFNTAVAVKFDLSQIPNDVQVDLAELIFSTDSDSTFYKTINISVYSAFSEWSSSDLFSPEDIRIDDSLSAVGYTFSGELKNSEINVTRLVGLWVNESIVNNGFVLKVEEEIDSFNIAKINNIQDIKLSIYYSK